MTSNGFGKSQLAQKPERILALQVRRLEGDCNAMRVACRELDERGVQIVKWRILYGGVLRGDRGSQTLRTPFTP